MFMQLEEDQSMVFLKVVRGILSIWTDGNVLQILTKKGVPCQPSFSKTAIFMCLEVMKEVEELTRLNSTTSPTTNGKFSQLSSPCQLRLNLQLLFLLLRLLFLGATITVLEQRIQ